MELQPWGRECSLDAHFPPHAQSSSASFHFLPEHQGKGAPWDFVATEEILKGLEYMMASSGSAENEHLCWVATEEVRLHEETSYDIIFTDEIALKRINNVKLMESCQVLSV